MTNKVIVALDNKNLKDANLVSEKNPKDQPEKSESNEKTQHDIN